MLYTKTNFYKSQPPLLPQQFGGGCFLANRITTKLHLHFPLPHYNGTVLYSKTNFYKSQPPQLPQQFGGGCYLANRITTKLHLHFPLPHYNGTVLYTKTNFYKSQPPLLPQQFGGGGAFSQTGLPQNSISTSPSPITMTPCYILKQTFYKSQPPQLPQQFEGGAITQTGLPQNSISTSPSPITMTPCYILKRTFTKAQQFGGVLSRKPDYHKTPSPLPPSPITMAPCYILKRTFTKVNLLNYPNNLGGCFLANRITTKLHLHFPLPHYNDTVQYSKTNFYKSQPPQLPQQFGGVLSRKPDYHKTPSPLPSPPLQWHRAIF